MAPPLYSNFEPIRCGVLERNEATHEMTPNPDKGTLYLNESEGKFSIAWENRNQDPVTEDQDLCPIRVGMAQLSMVPVPGARAFYLKVTPYDDMITRHRYYWFLSPDMTQNEKLLKEANDYLTGKHPKTQHLAPADSAQEQDQKDAAGPSVDTEMEDANPEPAREASAQAPQAALTGDYLQSVLQSLGGSFLRPQNLLPSLSHVLQAGNIVPLLQEPSVQSRLSELIEHLPEEQQEEAKQNISQMVEATIRSPQVQNQTRMISAALANSDLDVTQLGLEFQGYTAADFLESVQKAYSRKNKSEDNEVKSPAHQRPKLN